MQDPIIPVLQALYEKNLGQLKDEISSYENEKNLWVIADGITNCGGNLCLHLVGNLNTFICALYGKTGYVRDREAEFADKDVPVSKLNKMIDQTLIDLKMSLEKLSKEDLDSIYPIPVIKNEMTTRLFMVHLATHLTYHVGQINYHRRLLDK